MLIVVRHGRTAANAGGLLLGRADPPLDAVGAAQAAAVAALLAERAVSAVVTSPLERAAQTAAAIADRCGIEGVEVDDRWVELDYGALEGTPTADVPPDVWTRWRADPDFVPAGGESLHSLRTRVELACADAMVRDMGLEGDVVVVSHVSPIKSAVGWAIGVDDRVNWRTFVAPGSITRIGGTSDHPVLRSFNEAARPLEAGIGLAGESTR